MLCKLNWRKMVALQVDTDKILKQECTVGLCCSCNHKIKKKMNLVNIHTNRRL
jgi:hypothetical protein